MKRTLLLIPMILLALASGCDEDERLVKLAQDADQRQAEQNHEIAHQNRQIAETAKQLVEADAKSRQELMGLERDLQAERAEVGKQRDVLEADRRELASQRQWDSLLAPAIENSGLLVACVLPLVICWLLLRDLKSGGDDEALGELLTIELTAQEPTLLPSSSGLEPPSDRLLGRDVACPAITNERDESDLPF